MMLAGMLLLASAGWSTMDQVQVKSMMDVSVSKDGEWVVYSVSGSTEGKPGVADPVGRVVMHSYTQGTSQNAVTEACNAAPCSYPRMGTDWVGFIQGGKIMESRLNNGVWSTPVAVAGTDGVSAFRAHPSDNHLAFTVPVTETPNPLFREIDEHVIIDVIQENPIVLKNKLCVRNETTKAVNCFEKIEESIGAIGWYLSCWQYEAQFEWNPVHGSAEIAVTTTKNTYTNDWETFRAGVVDTTTGGYKPIRPATTNFQTIYSTKGDLIAFVELDNNGYTWAQDWHICVYDVTKGSTTCAPPVNSTRDQMPTLIAFEDDSTILYTEQSGTSIRFFRMHIATFTYTAVTPTGLPSCTSPIGDAGCGVIGGGFRASDVPHSTAGAAYIGITYETMEHPQEVYRCVVGTFTCVKVSGENQRYEGNSWKHSVLSYVNVNDGTPIEAITLGEPSAEKLIVFTHCGPAMAVLQTFLGYGTVCAAFPVATLVEQGYYVVMPNYRGSTGYGSVMRNSDQFDWGGEDYNDIMSAFVKYGSGKKTVSHMGWSYGGYMSALVLTKAKQTHNIDITSIVTGGTLTDLISQQGTTDIYKLYKSVFGGYYWESPAMKAKLMAASGIYHVENASAPIQMFHGVDDPRMPLSQAFQMHMALKSRGVTSRFTVFPGSGHIPGNPNQRLVIWNQTLEWFQQHNN